MQLSDKNKKINKKTFLLMTVNGITEMIYVIILAYSLMYAFNPGMAKAVIATSTLVIALLGTYLFKDAKLNKYNWSGCFLIVIGVIAMSQLNTNGHFLMK